MPRKDSRKLLAGSLGLLLAGFVLAACSGGATPQAFDVATSIPETTAGGEPAGEIDGCALVTQGDAEGVMAGPVAEGVGSNSAPNYSCTYTNENYDELKVFVAVYDTPKEASASFLATYDYGGYTMVSGVGDQAYEAAPVFDLYVLHGVYEISVDITDGNSADLQLQYAIEIAELVISRLP